MNLPNKRERLPFHMDLYFTENDKVHTKLVFLLLLLTFTSLHKHSSLLHNTYRILFCIVHTFYMENDAEIFPVHYAWKVAEKGFKMASMMNKLAIMNSCEIILKKFN